MVEEGCVLGGCGLQVLSGDRSSVSKQWFNMLLKPELKAALALSGFPAFTPLVHLVYPLSHTHPTQRVLAQVPQCTKGDRD